MREGYPEGWGAHMELTHTYGDLTWCFTAEEIKRGLRELYQVPTELPPKLLALVRKLAAVEGSSPRSRTLVGKLDAIEGAGSCLRSGDASKPQGLCDREENGNSE
jgi:hypothetical protein